MATKTLELDNPELTEEGKIMWNNIAQLEKMMAGESLLLKKKIRVEKINQFEIGLAFLRVELKRMIENSKKVIIECDEIIKKYKTKEEYLSSDAKVAKLVHTNLIERLQRVLQFKPAFDHEVKIPDED